MACGDVLTLEDLQTAKKHQIFEAEVITGKAGGTAGGASIPTSTNAVTGQVQKTLPQTLTDIETLISSMGYIYKGVYAAGIQLDTSKDMVTYNGIQYANSGPFPKVTTGVFANDGPWVALSSATGVFLYPFTATSGQTDFTIGAPVVPGTVPLVFRRGVYQVFNSAYTIDPANGRRFIFTEPMVAGDLVQIIAMSGADVTIKGDYLSFIYKNAATQPATPTGISPAGWATEPSTPAIGEFTWVSTVRRNGNDNSLMGAWSSPSRLSGEKGQAGAQGVAGAGVAQLELVSKVGKTATYRFLLSDATYTNTFQVLDGADGAGAVSSVNGVGPDLSGNVQLTAANVGASAAWVNDTANTGTLNTSTRVRWLADTSAARNRTIGAAVTDLVVKDITGQAGTNNITITAPSGKTINGAATETVDVNYGWVQYVLVGTDFKTIGGQ